MIAPIPVYPVLGLLLATAVIARALLGGAYRGTRSVGGRAAGRILLIFGVLMWVVFLVRVIQYYRAQ
jgi:hypothetical protein